MIRVYYSGRDKQSDLNSYNLVNLPSQKALNLKKWVIFQIFPEDLWSYKKEAKKSQADVCSIDTIHISSKGKMFVHDKTNSTIHLFSNNTVIKVESRKVKSDVVDFVILPDERIVTFSSQGNVYVSSNKVTTKSDSCKTLDWKEVNLQLMDVPYLIKYTTNYLSKIFVLVSPLDTPDENVLFSVQGKTMRSLKIDKILIVRSSNVIGFDVCPNGKEAVVSMRKSLVHLNISKNDTRKYGYGETVRDEICGVQIFHVSCSSQETTIAVIYNRPTPYLVTYVIKHAQNMMLRHNVINLVVNGLSVDISNFTVYSGTVFLSQINSCKLFLACDTSNASELCKKIHNAYIAAGYQPDVKKQNRAKESFCGSIDHIEVLHNHLVSFNKLRKSLTGLQGSGNTGGFVEQTVKCLGKNVENLQHFKKRLFSESGDLVSVKNKELISINPLVLELYVEHGFGDAITTPGLNPTLEDYFYSKGKRELKLLIQVSNTPGFNFRSNTNKLYGTPSSMKLHIDEVLNVLRRQRTIRSKEKKKNKHKKIDSRKKIVLSAVRMTKAGHTLANRSRQKCQPGVRPFLPILSSQPSHSSSQMDSF